MTANEYQTKAARTIPGYDTRKQMLYHAVFGLASEAGEVAGIFQKEYQGHEINRDDLVHELGDCLWMICEACGALGVSLDYVMQANIDKLLERYPDGFSAEKSIHRKEYEYETPELH